MAIKFLLPDGEDTDIVAHSYNGFPVSTPEDFVSFLNAVGATDRQPLASFLETHEAARAIISSVIEDLLGSGLVVATRSNPAIADSTRQLHHRWGHDPN